MRSRLEELATENSQLHRTVEVNSPESYLPLSPHARQTGEDRQGPGRVGRPSC
jgi:hypothetical protein